VLFIDRRARARHIAAIGLAAVIIAPVAAGPAAMSAAADVPGTGPAIVVDAVPGVSGA
jgi:hypothetical protein